MVVIVTGNSKVQSSKHNKHNIQNWESPPCRLADSDVLSSSVLDRKLSDSAVLIFPIQRWGLPGAAKQTSKPLLRTLSGNLILAWFISSLVSWHPFFGGNETIPGHHQMGPLVSCQDFFPAVHPGWYLMEKC